MNVRRMETLALVIRWVHAREERQRRTSRGPITNADAELLAFQTREHDAWAELEARGVDTTSIAQALDADGSRS